MRRTKPKTKTASFYLLGCTECALNNQKPFVMPFQSNEARMEWARDHERATGHYEFWCKET